MCYVCISLNLGGFFNYFLGNHLPKDGGKLLSFSVLFLPHQQAESKSYV